MGLKAIITGWAYIYFQKLVDTNSIRLKDIAFFTDVIQHSETKVSLKSKNKLVNYLVQVIFSFLKKLKLFQWDLRTNNCNNFH